MKRFIVLMCFAIGLFVSLPSTSSGSGSPPDQVSFVAFQPVDFTAMVINQDVVTNYQFAFLSNQSFEMAVLPEKGGCFVVQDSNLELQATYLNDKIAISDVSRSTMVDNYDFRTCLYFRQNERQLITKHNIESQSRCTIRADSQV